MPLLLLACAEEDASVVLRLDTALEISGTPSAAFDADGLFHLEDFPLYVRVELSAGDETLAKAWPTPETGKVLPTSSVDFQLPVPADADVNVKVLLFLFSGGQPYLFTATEQFTSPAPGKTADVELTPLQAAFGSVTINAPGCSSAGLMNEAAGVLLVSAAPDEGATAFSAIPAGLSLVPWCRRANGRAESFPALAFTLEDGAHMGLSLP